MARTPEQIAADDALHEAIRAVSAAYDDPETGDGRQRFIVDWLVVVVNQPVDEGDDNGNCYYETLFPNGTIPAYRALGMIEAAHMILSGQGMTEVGE